MRDLGLRGVIRGKPVPVIIAEEDEDCASVRKVAERHASSAIAPLTMSQRCIATRQLGGVDKVG